MYKDRLGGNHYKESNNYFLEFDKSATSWSDSFLFGDGTLGSAIYGDLFNETIELSHNTFFSGEKQHLKRDKAPKAFLDMRKSILNNDFEKSVKDSSEFIGVRGNFGSNLPVGNIKINYFVETSPTVDYSRKLNINSGVGEVLGSINGINFKKEFFINHSEHSLYYLMENSKPISCEIKFENTTLDNSTFSSNNQYFFKVQALEKIHSNGKSGVTLQGAISVFDCDGNITFTDEYIKIENFTKCIFRLVTDTDFDLKEETLLSSIDENIFKLNNYNYKNIKSSHIKETNEFMNRLDISFNNNDNLSEFMLQYGRYLLMSSSRKDSKLPAHLQGIWNDNVACRIGWSCDMHLDINTQMNYWFCEAANIQDAHTPLLNWVKNILIPSGRKTAKDYYGLNGWSADLVSNAWGFSHPYWHSNISPCPTSGIWVASDFVENYKFSKDKETLINLTYPVIEDAVEFFIEYVFENGDGYSVGPSISPENSFIVDGSRYFFSLDSTYERLMIKELFTQYLYLCKEKGEDGKFSKKIETILENFPIYKIDSTGKIMEFHKEYKEYDPQHRHTSHLLGLYPYLQITPKKTPTLAAAALKSIEGRLVHYENWEDTGWARSMLILYMARLKNGDKAYWHIQEMYRKLLNYNYLVIHPPTREAPSFKEVYELDGNTGLANGILEMLILSSDESIDLLPALPKEWSTGHLKGVRAYGNIEIDMIWKDGNITNLEIKSAKDTEINFTINNKKKLIILKKGITTINL